MENTETLEVANFFHPQVVKLNVSDIHIKKLKDEILPLKINGDKEMFAKVYEGRQRVKKLRTHLVRYADGLKEQALAWQRKVNAEKNRVVKELDAIEDYLQKEEDAYNAEKQRISDEKKRMEDERVQERINKLSSVDYRLDYVVVKALTDAAFDKVLADAHLKFEEAKAAKAAKEEADLAAQLKLRNDQVELEEKRKELRRVEFELTAEKIRLEGLEAERLRLENEEKIRADEAEKTRVRLENEKKQKEADEAEKLALASDTVKLKKINESITNTMDSILAFEMKSKKARLITEDVINYLQSAIDLTKHKTNG